MPSSRTSEPWALLRRALGVVLAGVVAACIWGYGIVVVAGDSMRPALCSGDVLVYRRSDAGVASSDVVVFEHRGDAVVHRVVDVLPDGALRTRGDANRFDDPTPVDRRAVRGEVVAVVPLGQWARCLAALSD